MKRDSPHPRAWAQASALLVALLFGLMAPQQARAQDNAAAEAAWLDVELKKEGLRRLVELAAAGKNAETTRLIRERASIITDDYARRSGSLRKPDKLLADMFSAELSAGRLTAADLKIDPWYRNNMKSAYRVTRIGADRLPALSGYNPPMREGYLPEVEAIDTRARHSMGDLPDYLENRFTNTALDRIVARGHPVEIHVGNITETLASLQNRGYKVYGEIKSANGNYERLFMAESPTGKVTYAVTGINGLDRVRHLSTLLRFAGPDRAGVAAENVRIVGDISALKEGNYRSFRSGLTHLGEPGGMALIGFRGGVNKELTRRALSRRGAEHAHNILGASNPYEGLLTRLEAERASAAGAHKRAVEASLSAARGNEALRRGLNASPLDVFRYAESADRFAAAEKALGELASRNPDVKLFSELLADGRMRLPGGARAADFVASRALEHGPFRADELRVRTKEGPRSLKLIANYYGDVMGDMGRALIDSGYRRIGYFGTAGGLAEGTRIGDVHVPEAVFGSDGELRSRGLNNELIEHIERNGSGALGERVHTRTRLANVFTPLMETEGWMENARRTRMGAVEVENSYLAEEIVRHNKRVGSGDRVRFMSSVMISDIPGSEHTLGNNNGSTRGLFERMIDNYISALGIQDIDILEKARLTAEMPARWSEGSAHERRAYELAERLAGSGSDRMLLRERVATLLAEGVKPESLTRSARASELNAVEGIEPTLKARLAAELASPGTNAELVTSLSATEAALGRATRELARKYPNRAYELRVGGGVERGLFSPSEGLSVELRGDAEVRAELSRLLARARAEAPRTAPVELRSAGAEGLSLGRGEPLANDMRHLSELHAERLLAGRGVNLHMNPGGGSSRVTAAPGPFIGEAESGRLFSRYETGALGPRASGDLLSRFIAKVERYGGVVERVVSADPRLNGGQGRTLVDADGRIRVLLPSDRAPRKTALIDELTHVLQLSALERAEPGAARRLMEAAERGDPAARARLIEWEIKARGRVLMVLPADAPERPVIERSIERLRLELDPYVAVRGPGGRIDWNKVKATARGHAMGVSSFTLGLFLKELARAVESGDRAVIEHFFAGLATTDFWLNYGLFSIGAEAGSVAYTRFLERFVKPSFVSGVLKSNVALAAGMALPEVVMGHFDGRTFAINLSGLMLSSAAVKTGLAGLRWVSSLERMRGARKLATALRLGSAPGWIYAGIETAVVLYFGEDISAHITTLLERNRMNKELAESSEQLYALARDGVGPDDPRFMDTTSALTTAFAAWRNAELGPAMAASEALRVELTKLAKAAQTKELGFRHLEERARSAPGRYSALEAHLATLKRRHEAELEAGLDAAEARYLESFKGAIRSAYDDHERGHAISPLTPAEVSRNRGESFDDEAAILRYAARIAKSPGARERLLERAKLVIEVKARDVELLVDTTGINDRLRGASSR